MMATPDKYNYYAILELKENAAQHEITTAYERARLTYSGDNPAIYTIFSEQEARDIMTMIEEAYSVLGNKTLRTIYDQRLLSGKGALTDLSYEALLVASKTFFPEAKNEEKKPKYETDDVFEKQIRETLDWDGALLRKVREYKAVSIEKMSEKTKINSWYISAIELMDHKNLPAVVFVRGYVVQIAKELGLNEKVVADSYMKAFKAKL